MKRTCAKIIIAALLAVLLVAGCKNDDDEDDTPAVEYKVLAGRLVLYSGDGANVIVPTGTASIGNNAFKGCARLGDVFIPASVTYIAGGAFRGVEIGYIAYGDTVAHWEEVVAGSSGLAASLAGQAVVCTDGVWNAPSNPNPGGEPDVPVNPGDWQITDGVLTAYTGSGTHVTVPDGVTAIGPGAFAGSDVTAADIPASVTGIGTGAFADGTVLTFHGTAEQWEQLVENSDLTGLTVFAVDDDGVLVGYSGNEAHVTIPNGVTAIGDGAFAGHAEITDVTIPKSVTDIGADAFKDCTGLADVVIPGSVTSIGDGAFSGCTGLTDVTILGGVETIGDGAFKDCTGLAGVTIPGSVTGIGDGAFSGCTGLTDITYGGSREQLEDLCADSGIDLSEVTVTISDEASVWDIRDGVLLGYYGSETDIVIPDNVTAIGDGAFAGNTGLTGVTIPDSVTSIGADAFSGSGLTELTYTGDAAAWDALVEASGIADELDGFSVTCSDREWKPAHTHTWGEDYTDDKNGKHYQTCTVCGNASAPVKHDCEVTDNGDGTHRTDCTKCDYAKIEEHDCDVADNGDGTHRTDCTKCDYSKAEEHECEVADNGDGTHTMTCTECEYFESEEHDYEDDTCAVCGCPKPSDWLIEDGVLLGYYGSETDIVIPDSVTAIGDGAFAGNTGLASVEIPAGVTSIGADAFSGCTGLTGVEIPAGVTSIGAGAFKDCTGLTDMTIPASVTSIGTGALAGGALETIAFAGTVAQWVGLSGGSGVRDDVIVTCSDGTLPTTVYVAGTGSDDNPGSRAKPFATIQKAVDTIIARNDGTSACTIYVDGTVTQSAAASANSMADFSALGKNLTLTIQSLSGTATLGANGKSRVINAAPASGALNLTLENLVITGGNTTGNGGGICYQSAGGTFEMTGCEIIGCEATNYGGGVYVSSGTVTITGGTISGCTSVARGGGVYVYGGTFTMSGGEISNCTASSYGGGVYINSAGTFNMSGTAKIAGCKTTSTSNLGGGGIYNAGTLAITGGTVSGCTSVAGGGGVFVYSGTFTMGGGTISECTATNQGGGVYINSTGTFNMSGTAKIAGCKTTSTSSSGGGGIYNAGTLAITGGTISGCTSAARGGGVHVNSGTFTMSGGEISNCTATNGGGVYVSGGTFTMESGTISECTASSYGGGVSITSTGTFNMSGTAKITGCKTTSTSSSGGGGIYNAGTLAITGGTISGCTSAARGGGVYVNSGTFTMSGGEISNCIASSYGGGVFITSSGTFNMSGTAKIAGCKMTSTSGLGGGVYVSSGTFTMGGSASIPAGDDGKNDVNLASGTAITVAGALTAASPVATITPSAYTAGTQVLSAGTGVTITQGICDKFALTGDPDGTEWKVAPSADGTSGVTAPRTYTFKIESGGSEVVEGSALSQGATITLREVRRDGVALTASDGTFTIELSDGYYTFASQGFSDTSATGLPATISLPSLPPVPMPLLICVKAEFANGIVIEDGIEVLITP